MRLDIRGIGWVTASGIGSGLPGEVFGLAPGRLPALRSRLFLEDSHKRLGRFDPYTKAGFCAIALALRSAGLDQWRQKRAIGMVISTRLGCLETDWAYFRTAAKDHGVLASPNLFAYTLPNSVLGEASIQFGLTGPAFVTDDAHEGHMGGVHMAMDVIRWDLCQTLVAGWCDVDIDLPTVLAGGPRGAVFFVLSRGCDTAPWQWDRGQLTLAGKPVQDIEHLVRAVLETRCKMGSE